MANPNQDVLRQDTVRKEGGSLSKEKRSNNIDLRGKVELPLSEAFRIGVEQIRRRLGRSILMIAAVTLSTAFMVYFLVSSLIFENYGRQAGVTVETYQLWLVVISFLVGMIGLTNSTLMAVYERYREIGTMKFLGALDQHILKLFMIESTIIGLAGGIFGFIGGCMAAAAAVSIQVGVNAVLTVPLLSFLSYMVSSVGLAVALSIVATMYPAYKAARLRPVEALAYEL